MPHEVENKTEKRETFVSYRGRRRIRRRIDGSDTRSARNRILRIEVSDLLHIDENHKEYRVEYEQTFMNWSIASTFIRRWDDDIP